MTIGIHHITAIASDAQENIDFYTKYLGLRLVKKTVNQDDTGTYHLFFGDKLGEPGMDLTFFIFLPAMQGLRGSGLVTKISLAVPHDSLSFWLERFNRLKIKNEGITNQFGHDRLTFFDKDEQQLELVGINEKNLETRTVWTTKEVSDSEAIRKFHSATLSVGSLMNIEPVLTKVLGYSQIDQDDNIYLFQTHEKGDRAEFLEVSETPDLKSGLNAAGTVHHIAFRAKDEQHQLELRQKVIDVGLYPTEVISRFYFKSVYFRTRAGILFEIATDGPGFTSDEKETELGTHLSLPPFLEFKRSTIEAHLSPVTYDPYL